MAGRYGWKKHKVRVTHTQMLFHHQQGVKITRTCSQKLLSSAEQLQ